MAFLICLNYIRVKFISLQNALPRWWKNPQELMKDALKNLHKLFHTSIPVDPVICYLVTPKYHGVCFTDHVIKVAI